MLKYIKPMPTDPIQIRDNQNGIIQLIDNTLAPKNSVQFCLNMIFDKTIGRATIRDGSALVGSQIANGYSILGLFQFIPPTGDKQLLAVANGATYSSTYRLESGVWTDTGADGRMTAGAKVRFLTYSGTVMMLDGTLKKSSTDGTAFITSGGNLDIGDCPAGSLCIEWHDRIYVAGVATKLDRLYYSGIPDSDGVIIWGTDYIDIEISEGQGNITALAKVPGYLLIFKERALKRWNGSSTFPDDLNRLGTPSQEAVVQGDQTVFFFSASFKSRVGFYQTNGSEVKKISRPIQAIVNAISSANYSSIAGFTDGETAMWEIGNITYGGIDYTNVCVYYHISTQTWSVFSYPTKYMVFAPYISGTDLKIIAGNNDGEVIELFTGTTDNITGSSGIPIEYAIQYFPIEFGIRGQTKEISSIIPYTKNGLDTKVLIRTNETGEFKEIGVVDDDFESEIPFEEGGIHTLEVRMAGMSIAGGTEILGFDLMEPQLNQTVKK